MTSVSTGRVVRAMNCAASRALSEASRMDEPVAARASS